ncbi:MAG: phage integrase N-terminal SAM-like domain-containing protein [Chitinophagaceae bacterium]|nr:phage integrase N-terminal SAM-like domain-containing protein [Chitinophagaceae bacterium]
MPDTKGKIVLAPLIHKGDTWIGIQFPRLPVLQRAVRKTRNIKWSQSNKCWYLPFTRACYDELLKNAGSLADIDSRALKQYKPATTNKPSGQALSSPPLPQPKAANYVKAAAFIHAVNRHVLPAMHQTLILKAYSPSTIRTYLNEMSRFLQALKTEAADISVNRIKAYLQYCFEQLKLSENYFTQQDKRAEVLL